MLFGEFLVERGKMRSEEVERLLTIQKQSSVPLGKLAVERSLVSLADIFTIRSFQRKTNSRFGEVAVKLGLLKPRQVDALLEAQKALKPFFGELLIREGLLEQNDLLDLLKEFKAAYGKVASPHLRRVALVGLELGQMIELKNGLSRLGYEVITENFTLGDLRLLAADGPDYLVLNLTKDKQNALRQMTALRAEYPSFFPRTLALVERLDPGDKEKAGASGITDFVPATAATENIVNYIHSILEGISREEAGKILLVDDSPTVLRLTSFYLEEDGYDSFLAASAEEALEILGKVQPDLILSDLHMPGMDGIELCRAIKLNPKTRNIPVVIITTSKEITRLKDALDSGASDYIMKPFQQEELLARVRSHIRTKRMIDELNGSRRELLLLNEKLADANNRKTEFLATVAHDLRTPLTSIRTYSDLLAFPNVELETQKEFIDIIKSEGMRMASLIANYLDVSRLEAGAASFRKEPFDLKAMAAYFTKIYTTMAGNKQIHFESTLPPAPVIIHGDKEHFEQVLANLLDNAVKFTPAGGTIRLELHTTGKRTRNYAEIQVTDTGPGIPAAAQEFLFKKFHHLPSENAAIKGTGLGLTICKEIVEWHGGKIDVESSAGKGATFRVVVPLTENGKETG